VATFCLWSSLYVYVPILPVYASALGASLPMVGVVVGSYGIAQLLLRLPLGLVSDRLGSRRPFVVSGLAAAGLGAVVMALAAEPWTLVAGRTLSGVSAASWVVFTVLFAASFAGAGGSARAMSLITALTSLAQLVSTGLSGVLAEAFGIRATFVVGALLAVLGILVVLPLSEPRRPARVRAPLRVGGGPLLLLATAQGALLVGATQAAAYGYAPLYATTRLGASAAQLGLLTVAQFLAYSVAALAMPTLAARWGARRAVLVGSLVAALGLLLMPLTASLAGMAALLALHGLGRGAAYPLLMTLSILGVPEESRAGSMGVFQAGYSVGTVAAPPLAGLLAELAGLSSVYLACGLACLLAAALSLPGAPWSGAE